MKELLQTTKDLKIIPNNFKSSCAVKLIDINDNEIKAELLKLNEDELKDYIVQENVEVFGVNNVGLIYFETKILAKENNIVTLAATNDYSLIQRREYSRVELNQGNVLFKDISPECILKVEDISAGGLKIISSTPLEIDKYYPIQINLSTNMKIDCCLLPIRITETEYQNKKAYVISGKFTDLENVDRIVLVQYAFKIKMENQNKED